MNSDVTALLQNQLAILLPVILLGVRGVYAFFKANHALPTLPYWTVPVGLLALSEGLAYSNNAVSPPSSVVLANLWWVQGVIFFVGLFISDTLVALVYKDRPEGGGGSVGGLGLLMAATLWAFLISGADPTAALAAPAKQGDAARFSTGLILRGAWYERDGTAGTSAAFDPAFAVTYTGTENFSLGASADWNCVADGWGGAQLALMSTAVGNKPGDNFRLSVGVAAVHYYGTVPAFIVHKDSWRVPLVAGWVAKRDGAGRPRIYGQAGLTVDPNNEAYRRLHVAVLIPFTGGAQK